MDKIDRSKIEKVDRSKFVYEDTILDKLDDLVEGYNEIMKRLDNIERRIMEPNLYIGGY